MRSKVFIKIREIGRTRLTIVERVCKILGLIVFSPFIMAVILIEWWNGDDTLIRTAKDELAVYKSH